MDGAVVVVARRYAVRPPRRWTARIERRVGRRATRRVIAVGAVRVAAPVHRADDAVVVGAVGRAAPVGAALVVVAQRRQGAGSGEVREGAAGPRQPGQRVQRGHSGVQAIW